jgi:acetaldehyde dehydrogenase
VPAVNMTEAMLNEPELNMVTCAGQATAPMVAAINAVADVYYAETVSSLASKSAGAGTRANIDEFTQTTRDALQTVGGADKAKAIIVLNPAEPPIFMSNTIYTRVRRVDMPAIEAAAQACVEKLKKYVPGYRLRMKPTLKDPADDIIVSVVEVEGLGDYLPIYAGNLDIINTAAIEIAEAKARQLLRS